MENNCFRRHYHLRLLNCFLDLNQLTIIAFTTHARKDDIRAHESGYPDAHGTMTHEAIPITMPPATNGPPESP